MKQAQAEGKGRDIQKDKRLKLSLRNGSVPSAKLWGSRERSLTLMLRGLPLETCSRAEGHPPTERLLHEEETLSLVIGAPGLWVEGGGEADTVAVLSAHPPPPGAEGGPPSAPPHHVPQGAAEEADLATSPHRGQVTVNGFLT